MTRPDFELSLPPSPADPTDIALEALRSDPLGFKQVTEGWFLKNTHVWRQFYWRANLLRNAGREHFGARAIYEVMRFDTAVADSEMTFKLNNNQVAGMARLYNTVTNSDFFHLRGDDR